MKTVVTAFVTLSLVALSGCSDSSRDEVGTTTADSSSADRPQATGPGPDEVTPESSPTEPSPPQAESDPAMNPSFVLAHQVRTITGEPVDLTQYRGKVVLIVNTASRCGLTPQYAGLQELYEQHKDNGLVVLGFPANNFGNQEPGTNAEIAEFCSARFDVTFPMFEKLSVRGEDQHPLYRQLAELSAEPDWNFTKYLVDRDGNFVERFGPRTAPDAEPLAARIAELLTPPSAG
jgi:glutathione peroxidase